MQDVHHLKLPTSEPIASRLARSVGTASIRQLAKACRSVNIVVVGLILTTLTREAGPALADARAIGIGLALTLLTRVLDRLWPETGGRRSIAIRVLCAAANTTLAFSSAAFFSILADGRWHASTLPCHWWMISASIAVVLELVISDITRTVVAGDSATAARLAASMIEADAGRGLAMLAVLDANSQDDLDRLERLIRDGDVDTVVTPADTSSPALNRLCAMLYDTNVHVRTTFLRGTAADTSMTPMMDLLPPPVTGVQWAAKRGFDLMVALALLLFLGPLLLLIGIAIRLETRGPILFRQWRFGQGSRPVLIYKFRTMRTDAADDSGAARTVARDPRVTPLGRVLRRLSIDELPQLLNVVRGQMSLVGPRPHALHMKVEGQFYHDAVETYRARHRMLPGITGWAQVNGSRGEVDTIEKARRRVQLDLWYIANWSPALDLWILLRTLVGGFATLRAD